MTPGWDPARTDSPDFNHSCNQQITTAQELASFFTLRRAKTASLRSVKRADFLFFIVTGAQ